MPEWSKKKNVDFNREQATRIKHLPNVICLQLGYYVAKKAFDIALKVFRYCSNLKGLLLADEDLEKAFNETNVIGSQTGFNIYLKVYYLKLCLRSFFSFHSSPSRRFWLRSDKVILSGPKKSQTSYLT